MRSLVIVLSFLLLAGSGCSSLKKAALKQALLYGLTPEQKEFVKKETAPGGKLDFIRHLSSQQMALFGSTAYNPRDMALLMWGKAVKELGVDTPDHAAALYEEVVAAKLTKPQRQALLKGYSSQ